MKKYKKYTTEIKLPKLPEYIKPIFYSKEKSGNTLIFAIDKEKNYTIIWDGVSEYPNEFHFFPRFEDDLYWRECLDLAPSRINNPS